MRSTASSTAAAGLPIASSYTGRGFPTSSRSDDDQVGLSGLSEIATERLKDQIEVGQTVRLEIFLNPSDQGALHFAMDKDEGAPPCLGSGI